MKKWCLLVLFLLLVLSIVYAHGNEVKSSLSEITSRGVNYIIIVSVFILAVTVFSVVNKHKGNTFKWYLFLAIAIPVIFVTVYVAGSTIYLNVVSESEGPVHWHADFEVWRCGEKLDLRNPKGFSNRIGNPVFHEHGDNRIHVEGVLVKKQQADLGGFIEVVGGKLDKNYLLLPTDLPSEDGFIKLENGDSCNGKEGKLQVFLYKVTNPYLIKSWKYEQIKLEDYGEYVLSPYGNVPPGDCIIFDFDTEKERTEHICGTYKFVIERGELSGS